MTVDIDKLKQLLAEWNQPKPKGEEAKGWEWKQRVKHGELAGEAVRALPQLLAEVERWRLLASYADELYRSSIVLGANLENPIAKKRFTEAVGDLINAVDSVDAARKEGT